MAKNIVQKLEEKASKKSRTNSNKRMGRPFKGTVKYKIGKEDNVIIKRSIFRKVKKFYAKGIYLKALGEES